MRFAFLQLLHQLSNYSFTFVGITRWSWGLDHEWQHWVVINIPGDKVEAGKELYGYFTPESPMGKKSKF